MFPVYRTIRVSSLCVCVRVCVWGGGGVRCVYVCLCANQPAPAPFWLTMWKLWMFLRHCAKLQAITHRIIQPEKPLTIDKLFKSLSQTIFACSYSLPTFPLSFLRAYPSIHVLPFPRSLTSHSHPFKIVSGFCLWYFPSLRKRKCSLH